MTLLCQSQPWGLCFPFLKFLLFVCNKCTCVYRQSLLSPSVQVTEMWSCNSFDEMEGKNLHKGVFLSYACLGLYMKSGGYLVFVCFCFLNAPGFLLLDFKFIVSPWNFLRLFLKILRFKRLNLSFSIQMIPEHKHKFAKTEVKFVQQTNVAQICSVFWGGFLPMSKLFLINKQLID